MQFRKIAAMAGTALMAGLTLATPVMAASVSQVNKISDFATVTDHTPGFLFVVGKDAKASDVAGAVNVAVMLAGKLTVEKSTGVSTTTLTVDGPEREVELHTNIADKFGASVEFGSASIPSLKDIERDFHGNKTTLTEKLTFGTGSGATLENYISDLNGTVAAKDLTGFEYKIKVTQDVDLSGLSTTKPLQINILGKPYLLTAINQQTITILKGQKAIVDSTRSMQYGDYEIKFVMGNSNEAVLSVLKGGTEIDRQTVKVGETGEFDNGNLKVYVQDASEFPVYGIAQATIIAAVGSDVEKTINNDSPYEEGDESWKWDIHFSGQNKWTTSDYIGVKFTGKTKDNNDFYLKAGEKLMLPEDYTGLVFEGYNTDKYATITIQPVSGFVVYNTTASTNYGTVIDSSNAKPIKLSADQPIFTVSGSGSGDTLKEIYIVIDKSNTNRALIAKYDSKSARYVNVTPITLVNETSLDITVNYEQMSDQIKYSKNSSINANGPLQGGKWAANFIYNDTKDEIRLGSSADAEETDVKIDTGSFAGYGDKDYSIVATDGVTVVDIKSNAASQKVVVKYPSETVKGKFGLGLVKGTTGGTYKEAVPVTSNVVKLDNEVSTSDKSSYDMVLVGGPCVNSLVADLATAGKFDYTCDKWPAENFGLIKVVKDAFASGKSVLIIAGTRAEDTMLAARVVQDGTKLASITNDTAKVTGTSFETVTVQ